MAGFVWEALERSIASDRPYLFGTAKSPALIRRADQERDEAEGEDGVIERGAEVQPEGGVGAGIVRSEEEEQHHGETAEACPADQDSCEQAQCNQQFGDGDDGGAEDGVGEDEAFEQGADEGVGALVEELTEVLGQSSPDEFGVDQFVLGKDEEEKADGDAEEGEGFGLLI